MKKIIIALAALAAAFGLVSCNKEQIENNISNEIKVNINVSEISSAATKAAKTGWEVGDKLNIWFDETNYANPDLVIKYDGSEWKKDATATVSGKEPAASGNLIVLFEGYNDWSKYTHSSATLYSKTEKFAGTQNGYVYTQPLAYTNDNVIAYTYASGTLAANLDSWKSLTKIQVVVTGLDTSKASDYALKVNNVYRCLVRFNSTSLAIESETYGKPTMGVANEDGVAFCFADPTSSLTNWTFTLLDLDTMTSKSYTVSGKSFDTGTSKVAAIKIDASKFE